MGTPSIATFGKFAIDWDTPLATASLTDISSFNADSDAFEYLSETVAMQQAHYHSPGIRGTRSQRHERTRISAEPCGGSIVMNPTRSELEILWPLILGNTTKSTNDWLLGETVPAFNVLFERVAKRVAYGNCWVSRANLRGTQGGPIEVTLDIEAVKEIVSATTWPATIPDPPAADIYIMADTTFALSADASAAEVMEWSLTIDNVLNTDRFMNSTQRNAIPATDRIITLEMTVPYTADEVDLYDQAVAGAAGTLTLTNPTAATTIFTFANLKCPAQSPVTSRRGDEIMLSLRMQAYSTSAAAQNELKVTQA